MAHHPAVRIHGLTKTFGNRRAVDGLSFELPRGVVAGFIGPNGAGKTTTLAMLLGLLGPTSGTGEVLGVPLDDPRGYLGEVGALIEAPAFYPGLSGEANLRVLAAMGTHDRSRIPDVLGLVGLADRGDDRYGQYSLGMKQRLGIAGALLGDPTLLILDEPTNGLDPAGMRDIRQLISTISADDRTVIVSSHLLSEIQQVCDHLIVIEGGQLVFAGPAEDFIGTAVPVLEIGPEQPTDLTRLVEILGGEGWEVTLGQTDGLISVPLGPDDDPRAAAAQINRLSHNRGIVLAEVHQRHRDLEDRYLSLVEGGHP